MTSYRTISASTMPLAAPRIACLLHQGISGYEIKQSLGEMFGPANTKWITPDDISRDSLSIYDVLVLPGIDDETSPYPDLLPPEKISVLKAAMEKNALLVLTFCGASYYMFSEISYIKRDGSYRHQKGAGLIEGQARHGFSHVTRQQLNASPWNDYILVQVEQPSTDKRFQALNINGPTMIVDRTKEKLTETFLRYSHIEGDAGIVKPFGDGKLIALGIHPEISHRHPDLPDHYACHEHERQELLSILKWEMFAHVISKKRTGTAYDW